MEWETFSVDDIVFIHDQVVNPEELQGLAMDKSLDGALSRVDHRLYYGLINDIFDLAATYAVVIATGHTFNDANKRTAYQAMRTCLDINGVDLEFEPEVAGQKIVSAAQGHIDEIGLASWLREQ